MSGDLSAGAAIAAVWLTVGVCYGFGYGYRQIVRERRGRQPVRLTYEGRHRARP